MNYYLGIDNGGTVTKAALYTPRGEELGICSVKTQTVTTNPGFVEIDMDEMWQANCKVIRDLISKTKVKPEEIASIAICGHGKGLYLWGKDERPVRNGIMSTDNRAWEYPARWNGDGTSQKAFELTCQQVLASQPVSLLSWLNDNESESIENIEWIFECKDYIRFRLTGQPYAEITDYSGTNLVNLHTKQYDDSLLELFGLSFAKGLLPPLKRSTDICGFITEEVASQTGLKAGTPVAGGMFDIDACAIAVDAANENRICMIAGTWSINEYIQKEPVIDGSIMMNSIFCNSDYYLVEECSPTSAGNFEWFINTLMPEVKQIAESKDISVYDVINGMVASVPVDDYYPFFLPFLLGSNAHLNAKSCFIGLNSYHKREHIIRSIYEGIAFSHRWHFERLLLSRKRKVSEIRLAGGVAKSEGWSQIFADVLQCPIEVVDIKETGTLGCAMTAAVAIGDYKNFETAAKNMIILKSRLEPNLDRIHLYNKRYTIYKKIIKSLDSIWDDIQELI
jgi:L-xylulokinase